MKISFDTIIYGLLFSVMVLAGCNTESGSTISSVSTSVTGTGEIQHVDASESLEYTRELGSTPQDVFFIFTNTTTSNVTTATTVNSLGSESGAVPDAAKSNLHSMESDIDLEAYAREHGIGLRGTPQATAFNANPPQMKTAEMAPFYQLAESTPLFYSVSDVGVATHSFMNESTTDTIPATLRQFATDGTVNLNIWVADDAWSPCSKARCMDSAKVTAFADKFLQAGGDNDIYDWMTGIFGAPWGTHENGNLIADTAGQNIDILFFDISEDDSTNGGILGFFWSKDNILASSPAYPYSNERLLFYMDSVLSATEDDFTSWDITDYWPAEMVSTLAHEFQHMIHFYQKNVTYDVEAETWINEMASMVAEDLLADKMEVNGPRGVSYADDTAGSSGNDEGRLPMFNTYDYIGPTVWYDGYETLKNYAINYAFGAYLARNYGGAALFQSIVQSGDSDYQAIVNAVVAQGYNETFTSLLQKWGAAVLLSDSTSTSSGYQYNTGSSFSSTLNGITYNLGSINLHNYDNYEYGSLQTSGPYLYTPSTLSHLGGHYATSNTYVQVGTAETGTFTKTVEKRTGIELTVVTKDSQ